jgi:hypothetical protein
MFEVLLAKYVTNSITPGKDRPDDARRRTLLMASTMV